MSSNTVHVSNIASNTSKSDLSNFFSFCGKITSLSLTPSSGKSDSPLSATVTFERESAAKTAVLLDGTPLKESSLSVKAASNIDEIAGSHLGQNSDIGPDGEIPQENKPRSAIFAEYLASGYVLGDAVLERGIELDKKHGLTAKFASYLTSALQAFDSRTHASDTAKSMDNQYHLTEKAMGAKSSLARYFEKALETGAGNKLRQFYVSSEKQALDIHNEARRLAELKLQQKRQSQEMNSSKTLDGHPFVEPENTTCACGGEENNCGCVDGKCGCAGCGKAGSSAKNEAESKASVTGQFEHAFQDIKGTAQDVVPEKS
jgi:RNA recognition motif-containing protein